MDFDLSVWILHWSVVLEAAALGLGGLECQNTPRWDFVALSWLSTPRPTRNSTNADKWWISGSIPAMVKAWLATHHTDKASHWLVSIFVPPLPQDARP